LDPVERFFFGTTKGTLVIRVFDRLFKQAEASEEKTNVLEDFDNARL
jgi:hypothetical protein